LLIEIVGTKVNIILMNNLQLNEFSSHIFWDVDVNKLDIDNSRKLIIKRVLDYGLMRDWNILIKIYSISEIAVTAATIRDLDKKSASFIAYLSNIPKDQFLCFSSKQLMPEHLTFW
jgi:hypothetical protein